MSKKVKEFPKPKEEVPQNPNAPIWIDVKSNQYPVPGQRVLITVQHKTIPGLGSMLVGRYRLTGEWVVDPPYIRYDNLTDGKGNLKGSYVSHWANANEEVLYSWDHQNDVIGKWGVLNIDVNQSNEEDVYKALTLANSYIRQVIESIQNNGQQIPKDQLQEMIAVMNILLDLRNSITIVDDPEGFVYDETPPPEDAKTPEKEETPESE